MQIDAALDYARKYEMEALVAARDGTTFAQEYAGTFAAATPHALYSGTKSFWGPTALCAQSDGLLDLDEPVADTIESWRDDPWERHVTLRMLLSLTAGFGFGGLGSAVPTYDRALSMTLKNDPGSTFTYGGISLQVFGAVFARKLMSRRQTPHEYLRERVLQPTGVTIAKWRALADGTQPLPTGAFLTAANWLAYGNYVLRQWDSLRACLTGSPVNPRYGLGWWLRPSGDVAYASGSGGQALYVIPAHDLVVVRFGKSASYKHEAFLKRLAL